MLEILRIVTIGVVGFAKDCSNIEEVNPGNLLINEEESTNLNGESNNIEQDNEGELEDDFEVLQFWKGLDVDLY